MRIKKRTLTTILLITITLITVITIFLLIGQRSGPSSVAGTSTPSNNVKEENGVQIVEVISTGGGYSPRKTTAKANVPTILRLNSKNSYGCERSFRIPSLNVTEILPTEGITEIDLGTPKEGGSIFGTCSMGMYTFTISFN